MHTPAVTTAPSARARVVLQGLKKAEYNGRYGIVQGLASGERSAVSLSPTESLSLRHENLMPVPTPSLGVVLAGADEEAGIAVLRHIIDQREAILHERGIYIPVLALVGRDGAVAPARKASNFVQPQDNAPHGGLLDADLNAAANGQGLTACAAYRASASNAAATYRRLIPALSAVAIPSVIVIDASASAAAVKTLSTRDFTLERFGGVCIARRPGSHDESGGDVHGASHGAGGASDHRNAAWLHWLSASAAAADVLHCALERFTGYIRPLLPRPPHHFFERCMWCGKSASTVCGGCAAVCYCSAGCQLGELTNTREGGFCHAAYCATFKRDRARDVSIALPGQPAWLTVAMGHRGSVRDECQLLERMGAHHAPYILFCGCLREPLTLPLGIAFEVGLAAALASLPPPTAGDDGRLRPPKAPLRSWDDFYTFRGVASDSPIALVLSFSLTVYHALDVCGVLPTTTTTTTTTMTTIIVDADDDAAAGATAAATSEHDAVSLSSLVVHYLGAAPREAALLATFAELGALLPTTRLRLCMVGPNAPSGDVQPRTCFDSGGGGCVEVTWHRGYYDELDLPPAHVAVAPNAGIGEYDSWQPAIAVLHERRTPFVFTDYSEIGILASAVTIRENHGLALSRPAALNPFRQPLERGMLVPHPGASHAMSAAWMGNGFVAALL